MGDELDVGDRDLVAVLVVHCLHAGVLPAQGVVRYCRVRSDVVVVVVGADAPLNLCAGECHRLDHAGEEVVDASVVPALVGEFNLVAHEADDRDSVERLRKRIGGRLVGVLVVDVEDVAVLLLVEMVMGGDDAFGCRVERHEVHELGERNLGLRQLAFLVLFGERHDFKYDYVGGVLESRGVAVEHDEAGVHRLHCRHPVLHAECEEGVPVVEHVLVLL